MHFGGYRQPGNRPAGFEGNPWSSNQSPATSQAPIFPPDVHDDMSFGEMCETLKSYCAPLSRSSIQIDVLFRGSLDIPW